MFPGLKRQFPGSKQLENFLKRIPDLGVDTALFNPVTQERTQNQIPRRREIGKVFADIFAKGAEIFV